MIKEAYRDCVESKKLQQIKEAHAMYLASEAERFGYYKELVDEVYDRQKLSRAKREGREEGKKEREKEGRYNGKKSILQRLLLNKYKAVSYTHLDVYKRQVRGMLQDLLKDIQNLKKLIMVVLLKKKDLNHMGKLFI